MKSRIISLAAAAALALSGFATSVETDRDWYLAGEAMRVSVTADNAMIAYAELCDTYGLAAGVVMGLQGGKATGIVELPSDLHSGYYVLSVYTRDDTKVSHRLVAVVNTLHRSEDDDVEWVEITHSDSSSYHCSKFMDGPGSGHEVLSSLVSEKMPEAHETEGHIIKAHVRNVYNGCSIKGSQIRPSLSIVGKQIHYFEGKMENDSTAVFYTFGVHGKHQLVLSAMSHTGVSLPVEMISPFATLLPKRLPHLVFHYKRSEVEARSIDMQRHQRIRERVNQGTPAETVAVPLDYDDKVFGTRPDLTYNLDEYRQFLTIREVLIEYVHCVRKRKTNGIPQLFVRREQDHYKSSWPAMVLIDGMPVNDIERLLDYDARRIHYINIYGGQYTFGNGVYNGILSFITRSGELTNYPTERNVQYLVYGFP